MSLVAVVDVAYGLKLVVVVVDATLPNAQAVVLVFGDIWCLFVSDRQTDISSDSETTHVLPLYVTLQGCQANFRLPLF